MIEKEINIKTTSNAAKDTVNTLIKMHNTVSAVKYIDALEKDAQFFRPIKKAYKLVTQTVLDIDNIDVKLHDLLFLLLIEAKLAYELFCENCKNSEISQLLTITHYQATKMLMMLKN